MKYIKPFSVALLIMSAYVDVQANEVLDGCKGDKTCIEMSCGDMASPPFAGYATMSQCDCEGGTISSDDYRDSDNIYQFIHTFSKNSKLQYQYIYDQGETLEKCIAETSEGIAKSLDSQGCSTFRELDHHGLMIDGIQKCLNQAQDERQEAINAQQNSPEEVLARYQKCTAEYESRWALPFYENAYSDFLACMADKFPNFSCTYSQNNSLEDVETEYSTCGHIEHSYQGFESCMNRDLDSFSCTNGSYPLY